jgi:hypothetical protein
MSTRQPTDDTRIESIRIGPDDPRYLAVVDKRFNKRFSARPDYVRLVSSTEQVVSAVEEAAREGHRLVATSGGQCLEGFGKLPAPAADQGAVGPAECVPACDVHSVG